MKIAVIGAGRIGSAFAFRLTLAGHAVTVVARGARLEVLRRERAIVSLDGVRSSVEVAADLDISIPFDLVLVTVLSHQVNSLLPVLQACAGKTVMFMFNTFERMDHWRDTLGAGRFAFAFPNMLAFLIDGRLRNVVNGPGMVTTLTNASWATVFSEAGFPTEIELDMDSFLRSHVAFFVPTMVAALLTWQRDTELTWAEAARLAGALKEGLDLVIALGHRLKPGFVVVLAWLPSLTTTALMWMAARSRAVKDLGEFGPAEVRALIDAMAKAAPGKATKLLSIRP